MLFGLGLAKLYQLTYWFLSNYAYVSYDIVIEVKTTIKLQVFRHDLIP